MCGTIKPTHWQYITHVDHKGKLEGVRKGHVKIYYHKRNWGYTSIYTQTINQTINYYEYVYNGNLKIMAAGNLPRTD